MRNPQTPAVFAAAMDRLRDEMAATKNPAVEAVGEIMTMHLQAHPETAAAIAAEGKTLAGAYQAMEIYARKHRAGAAAVCVPPARAEALILDYYGLKAEASPAEEPPRPAVPADDFDLDALLEV